MQSKHIAVQGNLSEKSSQKITEGVFSFALPIKHPRLSSFEKRFRGNPLKFWLQHVAAFTINHRSNFALFAKAVQAVETDSLHHRSKSWPKRAAYWVSIMNVLPWFPSLVSATFLSLVAHTGDWSSHHKQIKYITTWFLSWEVMFLLLTWTFFQYIYSVDIDSIVLIYWEALNVDKPRCCAAHNAVCSRTQLGYAVHTADCFREVLQQISSEISVRSTMGYHVNYVWKC